MCKSAKCGNNHLGVQKGRVLGQAGGVCLVSWVCLVVAIGCGDCSKQAVGEEDSLTLRVAQGQDVDVLQTGRIHSGG